VYLNRDRQLSMAAYMEDPAFDALHIRVRDQVGRKAVSYTHLRAHET